MRICHVIDYFHTDVGYQEYYLALEQARAGHAVHVISSKYRQHTVAVAGPDEALGAAELRDAGVTVNRLPGRQRDTIGPGVCGATSDRPMHALRGGTRPWTIHADDGAGGAGGDEGGDGERLTTPPHEEIALGHPSPKRLADLRRLLAGVRQCTCNRHAALWVGNSPPEARFYTEHGWG